MYICVPRRTRTKDSGGRSERLVLSRSCGAPVTSCGSVGGASVCVRGSGGSVGLCPPFLPVGLDGGTVVFCGAVWQCCVRRRAHGTWRVGAACTAPVRQSGHVCAYAGTVNVIWRGHHNRAMAAPRAGAVLAVWRCPLFLFCYSNTKPRQSTHDKPSRPRGDHGAQLGDADLGPALNTPTTTEAFGKATWSRPVTQRMMMMN